MSRADGAPFKDLTTSKSEGKSVSTFGFCDGDKMTDEPSLLLFPSDGLPALPFLPFRPSPVELDVLEVERVRV